MMKQIWKNLWSQRAQNVWLFAELVVVCFVAWTQIDPIVVRLFYQNQPAGFDIDRLVVADARLYKTMEQNTGDRTERETYDQMEERFTQEMKQLKQHLLELDEVAYVSFLDGIEGYPRLNRYYTHIPLPNDTIIVPWCYFDIGQDFFETFGIQPLPGSPSQHDLSMNTGGGQSLILTRSLAMTLFGTIDVAGRTVKAVADLAVGHEGTGQDCVPAAGVPGECCGELIKDTFSGHVSLSGTAFFSRTAEKHDGPRFPAFFQIVSQKERRPCGGASKEIVAAAVSIPCPGARPRFRNACFLGKTGEGVVLPEEADDRIALAPGGGKCRLHSGDPPGHQETFRLQK